MKMFFMIIVVGFVFMLFCVAAAFKIREYKDEVHYIKMEINRSDDPNEKDIGKLVLKSSMHG